MNGSVLGLAARAGPGLVPGVCLAGRACPRSSSQYLPARRIHRNTKMYAGWKSAALRAFLLFCTRVGPLCVDARVFRVCCVAACMCVRVCVGLCRLLAFRYASVPAECTSASCDWREREPLPMLLCTDGCWPQCTPGMPCICAAASPQRAERAPLHAGLPLIFRWHPMPSCPCQWRLPARGMDKFCA